MKVFLIGFFIGWLFYLLIRWNTWSRGYPPREETPERPIPRIDGNPIVATEQIRSSHLQSLRANVIAGEKVVEAVEAHRAAGVKSKRHQHDCAICVVGTTGCVHIGELVDAETKAYEGVTRALEIYNKVVGS